MGDAGSMFIGFMLGILSIMSISEKDIVVFIIPVYLMIVPIMDICMSVLRRLLLRKPVMQPDKMHFHHRLRNRFKNRHAALLILSAAQFLFSVVGIVIYIFELFVFGWFVLICIGAAGAVYTFFHAKSLRRNTQTPEIK